MDLLKKIFQKYTPSEYYYQDGKILIEGNNNRKISTLLQYGVSATSHSFELNKRLFDRIFSENVTFFYISDNDFETNHRIVPHIQQKFGQECHIEKIATTNVQNVNEQDKMTQGKFDSILNNHKNIFFHPHLSLTKLDNNDLNTAKQDFFSILSYLKECPVSKKTFVFINISIENFSNEEINNIHEVVKELKDNDIICFTSMSDYGKSLSFNQNFFGENGLYDEYWIWNIGEGREIYPYLNKVEQLPFFNSLPDILRNNFSKDSDFLKKSEEYFHNGHLKYYGSIVFSSNPWFFEPF